MNKLLVIIGFVLLSGGVMAQKGLHQGIKGAPQSTWMLNDVDHTVGDWDFLPTFGYSFGVSFAYFFTDAVGLGLDLTYSTQGQKWEHFGLENHMKLNYLKIPVLLHYHSSAEKTALFYLNIGPQISYLLSANGLRHSKNGHYTTSDVTNSYNKINIGGVLVFGAGFNLTDFLMLTAGLRIDADFTNEKDPTVFPFHWQQNYRKPTYNANAGFEIGLRYVMRSK